MLPEHHSANRRHGLRVRGRLVLQLRKVASPNRLERCEGNGMARHEEVARVGLEEGLVLVRGRVRTRGHGSSRLTALRTHK